MLINGTEVHPKREFDYLVADVVQRRHGPPTRTMTARIRLSRPSAALPQSAGLSGSGRGSPVILSIRRPLNLPGDVGGTQFGLYAPGPTDRGQVGRRRFGKW